MTDLDPDERHEVHNARVLELCSGEISGKEFVHSLIHQVGLSAIEAKEQWQALHDQGQIKIYDVAGPRCMILYPREDAASSGNIKVTHWQRGMITSMYANMQGAIVQTSEDVFSMRVPFALFELRLCETGGPS